MRKCRKIQRGARQKKFSPFMAVILMLVLTFLGLLNFRLSQKRRDIYLEIKALKQKIEQFSQQRENLKAEVSQGQTSGFSEKIMREELNLKKEGEEVVAFPMIEQNERNQLETAEKKDLLYRILEKLNKRRE